MSLSTSSSYLFFAIVPNDKLSGVNTEDWNIPSEHITISYKVFVDTQGIDNTNMANIVDEILNGEYFIIERSGYNGYQITVRSENSRDKLLKTFNTYKSGSAREDYSATVDVK